MFLPKVVNPQMVHQVFEISAYQPDLALLQEVAGLHTLCPVRALRAYVAHSVYEVLTLSHLPVLVVKKLAALCLYSVYPIELSALWLGPILGRIS